MRKMGIPYINIRKNYLALMFHTPYKITVHTTEYISTHMYTNKISVYFQDLAIFGILFEIIDHQFQDFQGKKVIPDSICV